jgi:SAM-dependent methyltransferase
VLFSYNGIDSFGHEDRMSALREIHRILRHDGIFCFSSHNLGWKDLYKLFRIRQEDKKEPNIIAGINSFAKRSYSIFRLHIRNKSLFMKSHIERLRSKGHGLLYDNSLKGRAVIYYVTYQEQIRQLKEAGFGHISAYSTQGMKTSRQKELNKGGWIYYLCHARKQV